MNCGQALEPAAAADADRQARLSAKAPAPLIDKMRAARLTGERKPVTAVFADVVGSTSLAEQMDPEDWTVLVNEAFDLMSKAVFRYEGTIAQLQGDAMVAFFGAPVAHEDDPERAVRAALEMIADTDEFARQLKTSQGIDFRIRAGINSGPVLVGNVGSDLRYEYTALGDTMNVSARMEAAAEPGQVVITANTYRFVADAFDVEDLGDISVKGKAEPVHAYRVIGLKAVRGRRRGRRGAWPRRSHRRGAGDRQVPVADRVPGRDRRYEGDLDRRPLRELRPDAPVPPRAGPRPGRVRDPVRGVRSRSDDAPARTAA
jgi:class 3 adenylate cyclase